jgi:replicative DNA helicase
MPNDRPLTAVEAEQGVIGGLMRNPELSEKVGAFLDASHFSDQDLSALYQLTLMACSKEQKPDAITLDEICPTLPSGQQTMRAAAQIQISVTSSANTEVYARIIVERYKARQMIEVANKIMEMANSRGKITDQIASAQSLVMALESEDETPDVVSIKDALHPVVDDMEERRSGVIEMGIKFGIKDLDDIVKGLRPGNLAIIAGRPGTGKTVLGMNLAENVAVRCGGSSLIFSLEMSQAELAKRTLSSISGVSQGLIETGAALDNDDSVSSIVSAVGKLSAADIRICDKGALTFARIAAISRLQHRVKPLSMIVIDYIGLITTDTTNRFQNRNQELGAISRGMKALAKELKLPVVALAQLNRGIESRTDAKPRMSDLRDSGEIEQDADVIIMAHRDQDQNRGEMGITDIDVVKCRHAKPDFTVLQFLGDTARFVGVADPARYASQPDTTPMVRKSARASFGGAQ